MIIPDETITLQEGFVTFNHESHVLPQPCPLESMLAGDVHDSSPRLTRPHVRTGQKEKHAVVLEITFTINANQLPPASQRRYASVNYCDHRFKGVHFENSEFVPCSVWSPFWAFRWTKRAKGSKKKCRCAQIMCGQHVTNSVDCVLRLPGDVTCCEGHSCGALI